MPERRRTARLAVNYALLSGGEFIAKVLVLVAFAYLARTLGPEHYGYLEFALAVTLFFTLIVDSGLSNYGAREIAKDRGGAARLVTHVILLRLVLAVAAFSLLALFVATTGRAWPLKQLLLVYGLTFFVLPGLLPWVFQGIDEMQYVAMASMLRWTIFAAGVLLLVRSPDQLWVVPLVEVCAIASLVIFYRHRVSRSFGSLRQPVDLSFALATFRQALPIGASEIVWAVKVYFATVLMGLMVGGSEVGWYSAAHRVVISLHTFVWLYFFNLLPTLSRCVLGPAENLQGLLGKSMQMTAWAAVLIGIVGTFAADPLIGLIYGSQYHQAAGVFRVLIWLIPLTLLHGHYRYALIAYSRQKLEFLSTACGAGLNVLLNVLFIPTHGPIAAAWAFVASELLIWALTYYFTRRMIAPVPFWTHLPRPLLAGTALIALLHFVPPANLAMLALMAAAVYGPALILMQPNLLSDVRSLLMRNP